MLRVFIFVLLIAPAAAVAQDDPRIAQFKQVFATWLTDQGGNGAMTIRQQDRVVARFDHGIAPDAPQELASLSKAITAVCISELVTRGDLAFDGRLPDIIGGGPDVTVASLLNHVSGITRDATQFRMFFWLDRVGDHAVKTLGSAKSIPEQQGRFHYNNVNYALLSLVIEAVSGRNTEAVCNELVLAPAGAIGRASPRTGGFLAWGGWFMSTDDYAKFHEHWFGHGRIGSTPKQYPYTEFNSSEFYGLGVFFQERHGVNDFWHSGELCFPVRLRIGSYAATWGGDITIALAYDFCPDRAAFRALQGALHEVAKLGRG